MIHAEREQMLMKEYMTYFALIIFRENSHTIDEFRERRNEGILMIKWNRMQNAKLT